LALADAAARRSHRELLDNDLDPLKARLEERAR
jgi:hypothetical protein